MVRKIINFAVLAPLAAVLIIFAVANRHLVMVSFDPFNPSDPSYGVTLPLFAVIVLSVIVGVIAGGSATWFRQGRWRRAARRHEAAAMAARAELSAGRGNVASSAIPSKALAPPA